MRKIRIIKKADTDAERAKALEQYLFRHEMSILHILIEMHIDEIDEIVADVRRKTVDIRDGLD